ncbi:MAG: aminotransferase class IV [Planctomycetes bacterium]|nr:aminotransferase class IV [Planctomycetota bacterium]
MTKTFAWIDGAIVPAGESPLARAEPGAFPEAGFFETIRVAEGFPWFLRRHRERLERSCDEHGIALDAAALDPRIIETLLAALDPPRGAARLRTVALASGRVIHAAFVEDPPPFATPFRVAIDPERRADPDARYKALPHSFCARAHRSARERGFDAAILLAPDGTLLEGSYHNVFLLRGGRIARPPEDLPRLTGITERVLVEIVLPELGIDVEERPLRVDDIAESDGVFLTNSMVGAVAAADIEGRPIADASALAAKLREGIRGAAMEQEGMP